MDNSKQQRPFFLKIIHLFLVPPVTKGGDPTAKEPNC